MESKYTSSSDDDEVSDGSSESERAAVNLLVRGMVEVTEKACVKLSEVEGEKGETAIIKPAVARMERVQGLRNFMLLNLQYVRRAQSKYCNSFTLERDYNLCIRFTKRLRWRSAAKKVLINRDSKSPMGLQDLSFRNRQAARSM